VKPRISEM